MSQKKRPFVFDRPLDHSIDALWACLKGENNLCIFLSWFMTSVAHIMSKKLLGSITILLVKFHWIETTLHHFECPTQQDYIQPKNILAPACVHYLKRIGIMQISLRYLLWNVRINAAYSNIVVAVVDIQVQVNLSKAFNLHLLVRLTLSCRVSR